VPIDAREVRRGRICLAVFPFAPSFPLRLPDGEPIASVDAWARRFGGRTVELVAQARLRPVLVLHDRTREGHGDVVCLRINEVKPKHRSDPLLWDRIERQEHPLFLYLPSSVPHHRLRSDSVIALASLGAVHRSAILAATGGSLTPREMQGVAERLARLVELDLAPRVASLAEELLRRGGFVLPTRPDAPKAP
jgi:hypothetical protein